MQIRNKLTYQFVGIVASVLLVASITIYILFVQFRQRDFYIRLNDIALSTAKIVIENNEVNPKLLKYIERNMKGTLPEEKVIIFNTSAEEIFSTDDDNNFKITENLLAQIRTKKEIRFAQGEYEWLGIVYRFKNNDYIILAAAKDIYGLRKLNFLGISLISVCLFILIAVYYFGWIYAGRALKPISKIVNDVENISVSNLHARIDEGNGKDEIAQLARTFNKMLDRIETAFNAQRSFVGNASHELRNPLSVIRGQLEVVLLKDRKKEDYRKTIESVLEDINSLTIIANRMLSLAQVSGAGLTDPKTEIRIDELLLQVRTELLDIVLGYKINISFETELESEDTLIVYGNEYLLKIAFFNLIENACKYSEDNTCEVKIVSEGKNIIIRFMDNGVGISDEDMKNIFEPFYRGNNVRHRKGHGIGLSLVEKIVALHGGSITVVSKENEGTTFTVKLPVS